MNRGPIRGQTQCRPDGQTRMLFRACSLGMGQKQLPAIDVKCAAERHNGGSHAERGNEGFRA